MTPHDNTSFDQVALVSYADLGARFGIGFSRTHLARLEVAGAFPKRIHPTPGRTSWLASEVRAWITARATERDQLHTCRVAPRIVKGAAGANIKRT